MHITHPSQNLSTTEKQISTTEKQIVNSLLRVAKSLHRAARSESRLKSLPILRRLISSETFRQISLPELHRRRETIQRKHILQMLALEAGYASWAAYKKRINDKPAEQQLHYSLALRYAGYPNIWFRSFAEAEQYATEHGGQSIAVGQQAVVIPSDG